MSAEKHGDLSLKWLTFFFVCFMMVMAIGLVAIATHNTNAPEPEPSSGGGHGSMILPGDGDYAPHVVLNVVA